MAKPNFSWKDKYRELEGHHRIAIQTNGELHKYIEDLENALIFMVSSYEEMEDVVYTKQPNLRVVVPKIQGFGNNMALAKIAKLEFKQPSKSFSEIYEKIKSKR